MIMRLLRPFILSLLLVGATWTASAQIHEPAYERVLVPFPPGITTGAFGSQWTGAIAVSNLGTTPVDVQGHGGCNLGILCRPKPIPPGSTVSIGLILRSNVPAAFLEIEPGRIHDLSITMRVFDQSRQHLTWGAAVPVITREDLYAGPFGIGDIPVSPNFRSTLRVFDFDATTPGRVRVRVYRFDPLTANEMNPGPPDPLLVELNPSFATPIEGGGTDGHPGYASIPLWLIPELAGAERVRVVIEPLDSTGEYWAMVSATHNETQHVTVLSPR